MKKILIALLASAAILLLPLQVHAAKGGEKGPSDRAYERASDNASFKRGDAEKRGRGHDKDRDHDHDHDDDDDRHRDRDRDRDNDDDDRDRNRDRDRDDDDDDRDRNRDRNREARPDSGEPPSIWDKIRGR